MVSAIRSNGALEEACVQLTFRALAAAIQAGLELPEGTDTSTKEGWNTSVNSLNEWLTPEEVTPAVEVEAEPLTQAETEAVVEALAETPQGEVALENAVAIAEEQTGLVMNEQDAIAFLSGQQILNAVFLGVVTPKQLDRLFKLDGSGDTVHTLGKLRKHLRHDA